MKNRLIAALAAAAFAFAAPAQASVVIDTFGPSHTFDTSYLYTVGKTDIDYVAAAASFTLATDGIVDDVAVAAVANNFTLVITGDDAGFPGSVLATISTGFTVDGYVEFNPSVALSAGTYWLLMAGSDPAGAPFGGWYPSSEFLYGGFRQSSDNGVTWEWGGIGSSLPAYRIGVSEARAVPEPGTLALLGAGIAVAGLMRRRRTAVKENRTA